MELKLDSKFMEDRKHKKETQNEANKLLPEINTKRNINLLNANGNP